MRSRVRVPVLRKCRHMFRLGYLAYGTFLTMFNHCDEGSSKALKARDVSLYLEIKSSPFFCCKKQSIGAPRSGALRSGAALRIAGARSERRSGLLPGALLGAPLRKMAGALPGALRSDLRSGELETSKKLREMRSKIENFALRALLLYQISTISGYFCTLFLKKLAGLSL